MPPSLKDYLQSFLDNNKEDKHEIKEDNLVS